VILSEGNEDRLLAEIITDTVLIGLEGESASVTRDTCTYTVKQAVDYVDPFAKIRAISVITGLD